MSVPFAFDAQIELGQASLRHRPVIVEKIERLLNARKQPLDYQQNQAWLAQQLADCFFSVPAASPAQARLREQLELAHWHSGFKPRANPGNDIIDAAALTVRAFHFWRQTRWPGQKGRERYAHTLFNVFLLRRLTLLMLRLWDEGETGAPDRLRQAQQLLDALWQSSPADQPVLVRDVRWLFPVAMSPTTDDLRGYFEVMRLVDTTLPQADRIEIHRAGVQTGAGHLRSQLRHLSVQREVPIDDPALVLLTRRSNTLDIALLMRGLVTLLHAYAAAVKDGDTPQRSALARAICEGMSPDPELFLQRVDLLGPYSMIEHLFISTEAGHARYTATGERHLQLFAEYRQLIVMLVPYLLDDCEHSRPLSGGYSPYGVLYGFSSNLLELIAFRTLQLDANTRFSMEDAFEDGGPDKLAWVNDWRNLPHVRREVVGQYEYPQQFAEAMHARVEGALRQGAAGAAAGRLHVSVAGDDAHETAAQLPALPVRHVLSSDPNVVAAGKAQFISAADLQYCRLEGEFVVSYPSAGGWVGIGKDLLTEELAAGHSVQLTGVPGEAREVLKLMCRDFVVAS